MFKSLLQTIPTLSGNISLSCEVDNFTKNDRYSEYDTYVKYANMMPLQNEIIKEPIIVNLLEGNWEYDVAKFYSIYESTFFEQNYNITKDDYEKIDLYENNENYQRDKNYEFGCKRLNYHAQKYQFSFYAPFYIDNINSIPDLFKIKLEFDNNIIKIINVHIGDVKGGRNYLWNYLSKYVKKIDDNVIFLLPEYNQCSCEGINVRFGGLSLIKDNELAAIYNEQMTINAFDYIITDTFKRNKLIMKQVIPLAFAFNINTMLNNTEKRLLKNHSVKITGNYYKDGIKLPFYTFENNYTNYTLSSKVYELVTKNNKTEYAHITKEYTDLTSKNYPSLQEANFYKYKYTNKLNTLYCPWKLKYSSDDNPYIFNMSFAFKNYIENSILNSNIYGEFPVFNDIIKPNILNNPNDPIDITLSYSTFNTINEYNGEIIDATKDNNNEDEKYELEKYYAVRNNHVCDWFTPYDSDTFLEDKNWTITNKNKCYHKGILYNLSYFDEPIDRFGIFVNFDISDYNTQNISYLKTSQFVLKNSNLGNNIYINRFNELNGEIEVDGRPIEIPTDDGEISYSYKSVALLDNKYILSYECQIKDMLTAYEYEQDGKGLIGYWFTYNDEQYPDLNSYLSDYYIDYTSEFFSYNKFVVADDLDDTTTYFGYVNIPLIYSNLETIIGYDANNEQVRIKDIIMQNKENLYISANSLKDYIPINENNISYIGSSTGMKYSLYKRYKIRKYDEYTDQNKLIYSYIPLYNDENNLYCNALIPNHNYQNNAYSNYLYDNYLYVDEYNINNFILSYQSKFGIKPNYYNEDNISSTYICTYARFINKEHLEKYPKYISKDINGNYIYQGNDIYDHIFERKRHISFDGELYDEYIPISYEGGYNIKNDKNFEEFLNKLNDSKTNDNIYFTYNTQQNIDLFFYKKFYKVTKDLYNAMISNDYIIPLQLYVKNYEDILTEQFIYDDSLNEQNEQFLEYERHNINEYLVPKVSDIYINNTTRNDITNLNLSGNISFIDSGYNDNKNTQVAIFDKNQFGCIISLDLYNDLAFISSESLSTNNNQIWNKHVYVKQNLNSLNTNDIDIIKTNIEEIIGSDIITNNIYFSDLDEDVIYTFEYNNLKYGFYLINIKCTNTKYSFRFNETNCMLFYSVDGIPYKIDNKTNNKILCKLIPYLNENIFSSFLGKINTVIYPNSFSIVAKYVPVIYVSKDADNFYKYKDIIYKDTIYDIKYVETSKAKINLNRYTDYITPYIKRVDNTLKNRYAKIFKLVEDKFDENNIRRLDLNIYSHDDLQIGKNYDNKTHTTIFYDDSDIINKIEYKHFNDNLLYNLEESFEYTIDGLVTYEELLELESFENTLKIFKKQIYKYNKLLRSPDKENIILFLYKRYNISYVSTPKQLNISGSKKLYELTYKFTLI